jgi:uncharacterized protein
MSSTSFQRLLDECASYRSLLVAFSGGVDSSLLLYTAIEALGRDRVLAVTAQSVAHPRQEREASAAFCRRYDIPQRLIESDMINVINARENPIDRCYFCKQALFTGLVNLARVEGFEAVVEGSNVDDDADFRPGRRALAELGIKSPLKASGLRKSDIREISRELGLPSWDRPACACLVSRFPHRVPITEEALSRIDRAEDYLRSLGFMQCRVRHYGEKARVEVTAERVADALNLVGEIRTVFRGLGYTEVEVDPEGYRMGSMNKS